MFLLSPHENRSSDKLALPASSAAMAGSAPSALKPLPSGPSLQALPAGFSQPKRRGVGRPRKADSYASLRGPRGSAKIAPKPKLIPDAALAALQSSDPLALPPRVDSGPIMEGVADASLTQAIRLQRGASYLDHVISDPHHASTAGIEKSDNMRRLVRQKQAGCTKLWSGSTLELPRRFDNWVSSSLFARLRHLD
jgi:hypothetical protein